MSESLLSLEPSFPPPFPLSLDLHPPGIKQPSTHPCLNRLMSDYEVTLVNDNMQEFYVRFFGPSESESTRSIAFFLRSPFASHPSPLSLSLARAPRHRRGRHSIPASSRQADLAMSGPRPQLEED